MNSDIKVVSWNVGTDWDHQCVNTRAGKSYTDDSAKEKDTLIGNFLQKCVTKNVDFVCLQEVGRVKERVESWCKDRFAFDPKAYDGEDTTILWNKDKYEFINGAAVYKPYEGGAVQTVAAFREIATGKIIQVASTHLTGFDLVDNSLWKDTTKNGDGELSRMLDMLGKNEEVPITIVGMDANTARSVYPKRLNIAEERGYKTDASQEDKPTNLAVIGQGPEKMPRTFHMDYVYAKGTDGELEVKGLSDVELPLENPEVNPSDHTPVEMNVTHKPRKGLFGRLFSLPGKIWHGFTSLVGWVFSIFRK